MIQLKSKKITITKCIKPTTAKGWKDIEEGHQIVVTLDVKPVTGASGGGIYATYFRIINVDTGQIWSSSTTSLVNRLTDNFKYR